MTTATATTPASAPSLDGMLLLEAPFARVPHDELRRQLRSQQRMVERDLTFCSSTLSSLASQPGRQDAGSIADAGKQSDSAVGDTSFNADTSFMSDSARPDDDPGEGDEEGEREVAVAGAPKSLDLDRSLDLMLGRLKGLKRKVRRDAVGVVLTQAELNLPMYATSSLRCTTLHSRHWASSRHERAIWTSFIRSAPPPRPPLTSGAALA